MQSKQLKNFLMTNPERIHRLLSTAGFHKITQRGNEIRCALPTMDNPTGVMIKLNETLYTALFELGYTGDLFGALEVVLQKEFKEVMSYIHSLFGIATSDRGNVFTDPLKELRQLSGMNLSNSTSQNRLYDESFLNRFVLGVPKPLLEEGVSPNVIREFKVGYDPEQSRIIFPHFDWEHDRKLVGVKGRITEDSEVIKELGIPKYWNKIDDLNTFVTPGVYSVWLRPMKNSPMSGSDQGAILVVIGTGDWTAQIMFTFYSGAYYRADTMDALKQGHATWKQFNVTDTNFWGG